MSHVVLLAVLAAALIDAVMHLLLKSERDCYAMSLLTGILGGGLGLVALCFTGLPDPAALPWLALSVLWGAGYWLMLGRAYDKGALGLVFPVARGGAVLLSTLVAAIFMAEHLSASALLVVLCILGGLALVTMNALPQGLRLRGLGPTLGLAVVIAGYTVTDAVGVRLAGSATAYCAALYVGNAVVLSVFAARREGPRLRALGPAALPRGALMAGMSLTIYGLVLFALQQAPVALVAALAETSIVFAAGLGYLWLREPARAAHTLGVLVIAGSVGMMHFAV
ncbi:EamA family transporter [Paragemmobacter straminiformis]|uniref:EamA family transporter n=1 Tax=Paragemmobacter straminiformis TaxID=2045119 RepID=A0A842I8K9_9RHOB|nr:EamA family transporter [Gemmobacter straminiformis]MBC2836392.1 EamA family transporter [Gemmobacter straminiformis]